MQRVGVCIACETIGVFGTDDVLDIDELIDIGTSKSCDGNRVRQVERNGDAGRIGGIAVDVGIINQIAPLPAIQRVIAGAARERVIAQEAEERVIACAAIERVIAIRHNRATPERDGLRGSDGVGGGLSIEVTWQHIKTNDTSAVSDPVEVRLKRQRNLVPGKAIGRGIAHLCDRVITGADSRADPSDLSGRNIEVNPCVWRVEIVPFEPLYIGVCRERLDV